MGQLTTIKIRYEKETPLEPHECLGGLRVIRNPSDRTSGSPAISLPLPAISIWGTKYIAYVRERGGTKHTQQKSSKTNRHFNLTYLIG